MQVINLLIVIGALLGTFALGALWIEMGDKPPEAKRKREIIVADAVEVEAYVEKPILQTPEFERVYLQTEQMQNERSKRELLEVILIKGLEECSSAQK